jgi:hypothetical protein
MAILAHHVDVVVTPDDIRDKGPGHALGDAGVMVIVSDATTIPQAFEELSVADVTAEAAALGRSNLG